MTIAQRIRRWREHAGLSKSDLARACDVTPEAVIQWERSEPKRSKTPKSTTPTHDNLEKVATAVGVSMAEFWGPLPSKRGAA